MTIILVLQKRLKMNIFFESKKIAMWSFRLTDIKGEEAIVTESGLLDAKRRIDAFHQHDPEKVMYYQRITNFLDPFKTLLYQERKHSMRPKTMTNAWLKCWELIHAYDLIPNEQTSPFRVFCNAELPGAFIFAIDHYIKTRTFINYEWFANSLYPTNASILGDEFGLYRSYPDHWLMNETNGGSVTDLDMISHIQERLGGTVDLYTSDIGVGLDQDTFHLQEEKHGPLHLGQIICALLTLKKGGHMVCKMFMFFKPFSRMLLFMLKDVFDELYISKPATSRPGNSEVYLVGKGYKPNHDLAVRLGVMLATWNDASIDYSEEIPETFERMLHAVSNKIYSQQIQTIEQHIKDVSSLHDAGIPTQNAPVRKHLPRITKDERRVLSEWRKNYFIPVNNGVYL